MGKVCSSFSGRSGPEGSGHENSDAASNLVCQNKAPSRSGSDAKDDFKVKDEAFGGCGQKDICQTSTKKILMVLTSHDRLGDSGKQTGVNLSELAHPYAVFKEAGFCMTFASPKGGLAPVDAATIEASKDDKICMEFQNREETQKLVRTTLPLKDVKSADFDAIFFVGGFGAMWDFPGNHDVKRLAAEVYDEGGVVAAVCHGPVALLNVRLADGTLLVKDKEVTAFTNGEEDATGTRKVVPYTCEDKFTEVGAKFSDGGVFKANVKVAGRLITGQSPPSAVPCAQAVVEALV